MTPERICEVVRDTGYTTPQQGRLLYDHIIATRATRCMELGFAHGVGTLWMAGAIAALGGGRHVAVDVLDAKDRRPDAPSLVKEAGLDAIVELNFDPISYTWHLKRNLSRYVEEPFDFVFIDGAHTWNTDGFAFFLVDRILKVGGWILFDDLLWSYARSPTLRDTDAAKRLTEEEYETCQIREVWEHLVLPHPSYGNFIEDGNWGWAQKISGDTPRTLEIRDTSAVRAGLFGRIFGWRA